MVAIIRTEITEALRHEGWAREFVRFVQDLRKEQDLPYDARIHVRYNTADTALAAVIQQHTDYIAGETLAISIAPDAAVATALDIDGTALGVAISV